MSEEWRIRECVNQMLLYVASEAIRIGESHLQSHLAIPRPLRPVTEILEVHVASMRKELAARPRDFSPVEKLMDKVLASVRKDNFRATIHREKAWCIGELVRWWLQAGHVIRGWYSNPDGAVLVASAPVLDAVIAVLQGEHDEEWPPFWCADHARRWKLEPPPMSVGPPAWNEVGNSDVDYRLRLLEWCGDPHREPRASQEVQADVTSIKRWMQQYASRYRDFARATRRLLCKRCRFGELEEHAAAGGWLPYRVSVPIEKAVCLRPPVYSCDDLQAEPLVKGWAAVPPAVALLERLRKSLDGFERKAFWTGVESDAISPNDLGTEQTLACLWPPDVTDVPLAETALLRIARGIIMLGEVAICVALTGQRSEASTPESVETAKACGRIRQALALEGIEVIADSGPDCLGSRIVPSRNKWFPREVDCVTLKRNSEGAEQARVIGRIGAPARCHEELLTAVERLDWRWWALGELTGHPLVDSVISGLMRVDWESIKRRLLDTEVGSAAAVQVLVDAFDELHRARLCEVLPVGGSGGDGVQAWLFEAFMSLEAAICRQLVGVESAVTKGLYPPRKPGGQISLAAWLHTASLQESRAVPWEMAWERSSLPFGHACREVLRSDNGYTAVFSAGPQASELDLRVLALPGILEPGGQPCDVIAAPLRSLVHDAVRAETHPDLMAAMSEVGAACAGDAASEFDQLVARAVKGDRRCVAWVHAMLSDERFGCRCHPTVEASDDRAILRSPAIEDELEWRDDDAEVDQDVDVRFATDANRARRTLSRGRPAVASAEAFAARLVELVRAGPATLVTAALALQSTTDRHRLFGSTARDALQVADNVAQSLVAVGSELGDTAVAACRELANWCRVMGGELLPAEWHPTVGSATNDQGVERVDFHPTVPAGRIVVERFGITLIGESVLSQSSLFVSAGPAPSGFNDVASMAALIADDEGVVTRFLRCVREFPKRTLAGQAATAAPGLFDVIWKAVSADPARTELRAAALAVHRFLDTSCGMVVFEPRTVTEYQESWLRGADGRAPQGVRVEKLLRPGLRTLDDRLVFPAIVETA